MKTGAMIHGGFSLEREEKGWRLRLKAQNGACIYLYVPDEPDSFLSDVHGLHLNTFARNATDKRTWGNEGMEGL